MVKREAQILHDMMDNLRRAGITANDASDLRRISMTLHRWQELECGTDRGAIEHDEATGRPHWRDAFTGKLSRTPLADREAGALRRLGSIMKRYPTLSAYVQGDCRGAALYILRPGDAPRDQTADSYYNRGIAVHG